VARNKNITTITVTQVAETCWRIHCQLTAPKYCCAVVGTDVVVIELVHGIRTI